MPSDVRSIPPDGAVVDGVRPSGGAFRRNAGHASESASRSRPRVSGMSKAATVPTMLKATR